MLRIALLLLAGGVGMMLASCAGAKTESAVIPGPLSGKVICLDPGHGGTASTDMFRVGPAGEREEWINLRVALFLRDMLEARGARVLMTRTDDVAVGLKDRALLAVNEPADLFLSIHHNATADPAVNYPIIYFHGNAAENQAGVELGRCVALRLREAMFSPDTPVVLCSDFTIFPESGTAVLRHSYSIPGVIGEASFFSNPDEEQRLKQSDYNRAEAQAYALAIEDYFRSPALPILEKNSTGSLPPFRPFQEAERMNEVARQWHSDYLQALQWLKQSDAPALEKALELFTRSVRSFPDSPVARQCHLHRSQLLAMMGRGAEAQEEARRALAHYVVIR